MITSVVLQNIDQVLRGKERLAQQRANADQQNETQHHAVLLCEGGYLVLFHHDYLPPSAARAIIFSDWISSFSKVPCTLPCAITTTRSHEPTISGNSEEIMIIAILHVVHRCNFLFKRQEQHIGRIAACGSICLFRLQTYLGGTEMSITKRFLEIILGSAPLLAVYNNSAQFRTAFRQGFRRRLRSFQKAPGSGRITLAFPAWLCYTFGVHTKRERMWSASALRARAYPRRNES